MAFHHLGIFGFTPDPDPNDPRGGNRVKVELYCEQMTLGPFKS